MVVSVSAALKGAGELAVGNALLHFINIGMVLAITALIALIPIQRHLLTQETPILPVTALAGVLLMDARLTWIDGLLLGGSLIPLMWFMIKVKQRNPLPKEIAIPKKWPMDRLSFGS